MAVAGPAGSTCKSVLIDLIRTIFAMYQEEDPTCILLPWKMGSRDSAILSPDDLPAISDSDSWNLYWSASPSVSYGRHTWFSLQWGYDDVAENFTFPSVHRDWFDSQDHAAYPHVIPESDHEVEIGLFVWSGDYLSLTRLVQVIHETYLASPSTQGTMWSRLLFGLKEKTNNELEAPRLNPDFPNRYTNMQPRPHRPISVFAHYEHIYAVSDVLVRIFNRIPNFLYRAGSYDISFLQDAKYARTGHYSGPPDDENSPENIRRTRMSQHILITVNLGLNEAPCIRALDTPVTFFQAPSIPHPQHLWYNCDAKLAPYPKTLTLRQVLLTISYPTSGHLPPSANRLPNTAD